jgi:hypothetical protein
MEIVLCRANWEGGSENLMSTIVLAFIELSLPESSFELREEVRNSLSVVPDMSAAAIAAAAVVTASLPAPQTSVTLSEYCWGLENGQVRRNCLDNLRWEGSVIESITENSALLTQ